MTTLAHLSITHCPPRASVPAPMSNADRLRMLRAALPAVVGNAVFRFPTKPATQPAEDF